MQAATGRLGTPLEVLFVREVMRTKLVALPAGATVNELRDTLTREPAQRGQHLYPVVDDERRVNGVITRKQLRELTESAVSTMSLSDLNEFSSDNLGSRACCPSARLARSSPRAVRRPAKKYRDP